MSVLGLSFAYYVGGKEDVLALQRMRVAFERAGAEMAQLGKYAFPLLIPEFEAELKGQWEAQGRGPNRGAWKPLSPRYAKQKERHYPGRPLLVRTGELRRAMTDSKAPGALRDYTASQFNFGTMGIQHASYHQTGTKRRDGSAAMPSRPPMDFTERLERRMRAVALQATRIAIKEARLDELVTITAAPGEDT